MEDGQREATFADIVAGHVKNEENEENGDLGDFDAAVAENPDAYHLDSNAYQMNQPNTDTFVRDDQNLDGPGFQNFENSGNLGNFRDPANFNQESTQNWQAQEMPTNGVKADFGRVFDNARDELKNIVQSDFVQPNFAVQETSVRNFPDVSNQQNVNGNSQNFVQQFPEGFTNGFHPDVNQRRSYEYSEKGPSFQPAGQFQATVSHGSDSHAGVHFSNQRGNTNTGQLDSPMAEFDAERRRNNSLGQSTSRPRRSRPVGQHVRDLVFWRNVKDSGVIFSFGLILLLSLSYFSIISIFAYLSMTSLILITSFVLIKQIVMAFQQQTSEHPFKQVLEKDVVISPDYAHQQLDIVLKPLNGMLLRIRNLYLADSLGQTLKLIFIMYILTYVGSWFNLLTLLTIIWVGAFTVPKFYVMYREQIDSIAHVVLEGLRDLKEQAGRTMKQQLNKIKPSNRRSTGDGVDVAGQIRTRVSKVEAEVKVNGGKTSKKSEKKVVEKIH